MAKLSQGLADVYKNMYGHPHFVNLFRFYTYSAHKNHLKTGVFFVISHFYCKLMRSKFFLKGVVLFF